MNQQFNMPTPSIDATRRSLHRVSTLALAVMVVAVALFISYGPAVPTMAQAEPGAITSVTLDSHQPGQLVITWETPNPAPTDYRVRWAHTSLAFLSYKDSNEAQRANVYPTGLNTLTINDLTPGDTYKVQMRSRYYNANRSVHAWSGPWTNTATQRVKNHPPAAPTGLTTSEVKHDSLILTWDNPNDANITGYRIQRGTDANSLHTIEPNTGGASTNYTDSTVVAETTYHHAVQALSQDGNGARSITSVTTPAEPQSDETSEEQTEDDSTPAAPTGLTASQVTHESLTLTWNDPQDDSITGYQVLRGPDADSLSTLENDTESVSTRYEDETVEPGTTYHYAIGALSATTPATAKKKEPPPQRVGARQSITTTEVPVGWSLKPAGLTAGDQFRLLFLSSTKRDGTATAIADYNTFVQTRAAAGHTDIQSYSTGFKVVGCTSAVDARDNTSTTYTSTDKGVPIYWLNGTRVADTYADFYDGSWDDEANDKNESGDDGPDTSQSANRPITGCDHDGTESFSGSSSRALGTSNVRLGRPNDSVMGTGPISSGSNSGSSTTRSMYGLSEVFQVPEDTTPTEVLNTWSLTPAGLTTGDQFRLLFLSSTTRDGSSTNIADYNVFVQDRAAVGHTDIRAYSSGFTVVGCTEDDDARDNTGTTYTSADKGVPIYWLNGAKVADDYEDFYDESWDDEANDKNESGDDGPDTSQSANFPLTGCDHDGTESFSGSSSGALGTSAVRLGRPNNSSIGNGPMSSGGNSVIPSGVRPMYGLSAVFQVVTTLVSNTHLNETGSSTELEAQSFETGANLDGYTVSQVDIRFGAVSGTSTSVRIRENNASNQPGALVATLANPTSLTAESLNTFLAQDTITLDPNTTYWISVNEGISSNRARVIYNGGNDQTGETGWSIGDGHLTRTGETYAWATFDDSLLMTIKGTVPCDGIWCATLQVQDLGSNDRGCGNGSSGNECTVYLSDYEFTHAMTDYSVGGVRVKSSGQLQMFLGADIATESESLVLHVGSETFAFEDADTKEARNRKWDGSGLSWSTGDTIGLKLTANATGQPTISGVPQVGKELEARKGSIDDTDGLPSGTFPSGYIFEWVSVDASDVETIVGTNSTNYTVSSSDVDSTIRVDVSFTDLAGNSEGPLPSDATAAVVPAAGLCPANNDWCTTMTVGTYEHGGTFYGFAEDFFGQLDEPTIDYGPSFKVDEIYIYEPDFSSSDQIQVTLDAYVPLGTVFNLGGTEFTADAGSRTTTVGIYTWVRPPNFAWIDGQEVRVSANLAPARESATVDGTTLVITHSEDLNTGSAPPAGAYTVRVDGNGTNPTTVSVGTRTVTMTLATAVTRVQVVTVSYDVPASNRLQDVSGLDAPAFTDFAVTNNTEAVYRDPTFTEGTTTTRTFDETFGDDTVATATNIGQPVTATDPDTGDTLTYTLKGTDAARFDIVSTSGQLLTKVGTEAMTTNSNGPTR